MKTNAWIFLLVLLSLGACTAQKQSTSHVNDEVYENPSRGELMAAKINTADLTGQGTEVITAPDKSTVSKPGSSTWQDDYNDYSYSDRIQRFNNTDTTKGYFDQQTSGGGASNQSNSPTINLSLGFGVGYGYYGPSFGIGWGYPYSGWDMYMGWGYPYYGWGYPYYGWGYPYYYGYPYNPYWYYPPCYDYYCYGTSSPYTSGTYYGSRRSLYRTDGGSAPLNSRVAGSQNQSPNDRMQAPPNYSRSVTSGGSALATNPAPRAATQEKYRYTRPDRIQQAPNQRTTGNNIRNEGTGQRVQPTPRYIRPENVSAQRSENAQSYSSPVYRQPKTSQEYLAPRTQTATSGRSSENNTSVRSHNNYASPVRSAAREGVNSIRRSDGNNNSYSTPQRSSGNNSYSAPTRSSSSGSSGGSYSAPSRSGSGSSGSSPSSGGSGRRK
jgi:hypothetical protein